MSKTKKKKKTISKLFNVLILMIAICGFCYSAYKLYMSNSDYKEGEMLYSDISNDFTYESYKYKHISANNPIYKNVNFKELLAINEDVVGWLYIPDTIIDYPVLQGETNDSYIHTSIYKQYLYVGTLFVDFRNSDKFTDDNTIIYGHRMNDGSMFGTLSYYISKENYYKEHPYVYFYTLDRKCKYQIIGMCVTNSKSDMYTLNFNTRDEYVSWLETVKNNSEIEASPYDPTKPTITLSTCHGRSGSSSRFVMQLQQIGSVSNNVYSQFIIIEQGGTEHAILCYCPWTTHRDIRK